MYRWVTALLCAASVLAAISSGQAPSPPGQPAPSASSTVSPAPASPAAPPEAAGSSAPRAANSGPEPLKIPSGAVLTFYLQTRLRPASEDPLDALPQGTLLHVKILRPIDSAVDRDGSEFHGWVTSDLSLGDGIVIHADSEVRGLLVLLRSRTHPRGFRYELLLTELTDHGQSYPLTASLNPSFFDAPQSAAKVAAKTSPKPNAPAGQISPAVARP